MIYMSGMPWLGREYTIKGEMEFLIEEGSSLYPGRFTPVIANKFFEKCYHLKSRMLAHAPTEKDINFIRKLH